MTDPTNPTPAVAITPPPMPSAAPVERGWMKLIVGIVAFALVPAIPQFAALLPIDQAFLLFVPALAACALVGWWAGGSLSLASVCIVMAFAVITLAPKAAQGFDNLAKGWSLVLAGSFGLACLFGARRPFFPRALIAVTIALGLALMMSALGPVGGGDVNRTVADELDRRNTQTMNAMNTLIARYPKQWNDLVAKSPRLAEFPAEFEKGLTLFADQGKALYPALLALQALAALAIAWSLYHRLSRARLGPPLGLLRDFRFNDQLVWGLIVGLTFVFLPTLVSVRVVGRNLLLFFGALYALRGLGVLSWFMAPGALAVTATVGVAMSMVPVLNLIAATGFVLLTIAAFGLGLGDTWADWRNRPRTTTP